MYKPGLSDPEKIVLVLQMISRCKVAKSIPSFLPSEFAIAEDDDDEEEEEEGGGARDDHREVEDVMETDNDDEELSSEEGEEEEEEGSLGEREGAGGDAWWEEKFDQICARYNPEGELDVSPQEARAWNEHFFFFEDEWCDGCDRVVADDSDEESIYNPVEGFICSECKHNAGL